MRSIGLKQTFWLAGYYDDFNGARAIADDLNSATIRTHNHENSHHGSIFGGTNILNPRYAYSYIDRLRSGAYSSGDLVRAQSSVDEGLNTFITSDSNKLTINRGIHEWLTIDPSIGSNYEHRANLQHPSSLSANRMRYNGASGSSYLNFTNGHDTSGSYTAPMGVMDLTFGADSYIPADSDWLPSAKKPLMGGYARLGQQANDKWSLSAVKRTHFASVYTGEETQSAMSISESRPENYLQNVTSPSEMPFLINNIYSQASSGSETLISYDGPLRLRGLGEVFHMRIASHQIVAGVPLVYQLKIGYKSSATFNKSTGVWSDTSSLATVNLDLEGLMAYTPSTYLKWENSNFAPYRKDEIWVDIYVVLDHENGTWKAYQDNQNNHFSNGVITSTGNPFTTSKGWSLDAVWGNLGGQTHLCANTLIDRVGVILPLNYNIGNSTQKPEVGKFAFKYGTNNVSTLNLSIYDDLNEYSLSALTTGISATEWRLLAFRGEESRPIWSGVVESLNHKQNKHQQTLETVITARDSSSILDRVLPLWETGGSATFSLNEHISMSSTSSQVNFDTLSLLAKMNMGASSLTVGNSDLGHNFYNVVNGTKFQKDSSARTHLNSGSAIQMYVGEDEDGPNFPDKEWVGFGFDNDIYSLSEIIAVQHRVDGTANTRSFFVEWEEAVDPTFASSGTSQYATIVSAYKGLVAGDTITVKGTGYDGNYVIASSGLIAHKRRYNSTGNGSIDTNTYFCEIRCTFNSADATTDRLFEVDKWTCKSIHYRSKLDENTNRSVAKSIMFELRTRTAHNLSIGDSFILPSGIGSSGSSILKSIPLKVVAVPTTTTLHIELESWQSAIAVSDSATITSNYGMAYDLTKINSNDSKRYPLVKPVLFEGALLTDAEHQAVKNRNIHSRIMRDLPLSPFFKAQFGIIDAIPLWRAGSGSNLNTPVSAQYISAHGSGQYSSTGTTTGWGGLNQDIQQNATTIVIDEPAILHLFDYNDMQHGTLELVDIETNDSQHVIFNGVTGTLTEAATSWNLSAEEFTSGSSTWTVGNIIIHEGFSDNLLNGLFQITAAAGSGVYKAKKIAFEAGVNEFAYMNARNLNASSWNFGTARHYADPDGVKVRLTEPHVTERRTINSNVTFEPSNDTGKIKYLAAGANITLTGVKGVKRKWEADKTIYSLRNNSSNSYKHLYVLWADMRNDGTADADGGFRKNDFGLLLPTSDNYKVQLTVADQFNENGETDVYTELKIGEDIDIWKFDAESEPYTESPWCSLNGGSNDEPLDTRYSNWDETAGAFIIIDASRYYNLNTAATSGRSGYSSGGQVDFGDYTLAVAGTPYLTDSYWKNAVLSFKNNDDASFIKHKNQKYMINDFSFLNQDIALSETTIFVDDVSQFDTVGYGAIVCRKGNSRSAEDLIYYFSWTGKGVDVTKGDKLTGVHITSYPNGNILGPKSLEVLLKADVSGGATGSNAVIDLVGADGAGVFNSAIVYNTTAALFSLRLMTNLEGYIPSANGGTFFAHDKLRTIFNLLTADTWAKNSALPLMYNFGGVPNTNKMTTTQLSASGNDTDSFGSIIDAKATTVLNLLNQMSDKEGSGIDGNSKTFTWSVNRDNMLTFRPSYVSGHTLTRNNMLMSSLNTQIGSQATNIRVFYNGNSNYADYPEPVAGEVTRWRILQQPKIFSRDEALSIAKQEYSRESQARVSITAQVLRGSGESDIMLHNARYGYVQDVFRQGLKPHIDSNASWCNVWGGSPFSGIQSALESAQSRFAQLPAYSRNLGQFHTQITQTDTLRNLGIEVRTKGPVSVGALANQGDSELNIVESGSAPNIVHTAKWAQVTPSGIYGASKALVDGWNILDANSGNTKLSIYCQSGLGSRSGSAGNYIIDSVEGIERGYNTAYSWHGTNSLSYALNIVHIDKGTNMVNSETGNKLRLAISIDSGSTADDAVFRVWLLDYDFNEAPSTKAPDYSVLNLNGSSSVLVNGNGYYPITIPASYQGDTSKTLFVSVNTDYLRALLRKNGGSVLNAHNIDGLSTYSSFNDYSAFPLGVRKHSVFGNMGDERASYYAPRVAVVDDINYLPSTTLTFTDTHIDLETQSLSINSVAWTKDEQQIEKVILGLERTERHFGYSLAKVISGGSNTNNPPKPDSGPPAPPDPPPSIPPSSGGGDAINPRPSLPPPSVGGGSSEVNNKQGFDVNRMSKAAMRVIKQRASFSSDTHASEGAWGIIGQKKPSVALSSDRDIDGIDSIVSAGEGVAIKTNEGFVLGGITDGDTGQQGERHTHSMTVRVPNDISTGIVGLEGALTLDSISGGGSARITTTMTCKESGQSISQSTNIPMGTTRESTTLLTTQNLVGAETAGNTLVIEISRTPDQDGDSAPYQALVIHNTSVKLRRNSIHSNAQSDNFKPY